MKKETTFRDRPINMDKEGHRKWIYAKQPKGKLFKRRTLVAYLLLAFFVAAPFIKINGHPLMLLDIVERKFIIFGAIFWAQDTFVLALLMLTFVLFIVVFTVTYGRIWCGWACPQTIFLEMIYRKIENLIEGDYKIRRRRDAGPLNFDKFWRKTLKHLVFMTISVLIVNTFLMWFIGPDKLWIFISRPVSEHLTGFLIMLFVSALIYWIYSFFREQICTMVCPYGRMQGVLLDKKSIIVAYDYKRGEPRGKGDGDCIDCGNCISVCPTGIDIKNGTQLECTNCTACIDECNSVMTKIKKPEGLIRFDSVDGIEQGNAKVWNGRNKAYTAVLLMLFSFFVYTLVTRPIVETTILRNPGSLYQTQENGQISNVYNIKIVNKTYATKNLRLELISHKGTIQMAGKEIKLDEHALYESIFVLFLDEADLDGSLTDVEFGVYEGSELLEKYELSFVGP